MKTTKGKFILMETSLVKLLILLYKVDVLKYDYFRRITISREVVGTYNFTERMIGK